MIPSWYKVRLQDGTEGFVSKAWTRIIVGTEGKALFEVHFLDVGPGDAAIIDIGDREIVIDRGDSTRVLHDYAAATGIIDGPVELLVVTHADADHWRGLSRFPGFDGMATHSQSVLEFWEPGCDRNCRPLRSYTDFIRKVQAISGIRFRRPLESTHRPAVASRAASPLHVEHNSGGADHSASPVEQP